MEEFHFGKTIKRIRDGKGFTQEGLAKKLGVTQSGIYYLEKSRHLPQNHVIYATAEYLDVKVSEITPAWWDPENKVRIKSTRKVFILTNSGHVIYIFLLISFAFQMCIETVESPLKIPICIAIAICAALIYYFTVKRNQIED